MQAGTAAGLATPAGKGLPATGPAGAADAAAAAADVLSPSSEAAPSPGDEPSRGSDVSLADGLGEGPPSPALEPQRASAGEEEAAGAAEEGAAEAALAGARLPLLSAVQEEPLLCEEAQQAQQQAGAGGSAAGGSSAMRGGGGGAGASPQRPAPNALHSFPGICVSSELQGLLLPEISQGAFARQPQEAVQAAAAEALSFQPAAPGRAPPPPLELPQASPLADDQQQQEQQQQLESEPSLAGGVPAQLQAQARQAAAEAAGAQPSRLSLSDWVPPGMAGGAGTGGPQPQPAGPAWLGGKPGAGGAAPTLRSGGLSAAAALESPRAAAGQQHAQQAQQEGCAPPDFTLDSPARLGSGRPPLQLNRSTGTRRSLLPEVFQPGSPLLEQPEGASGAARGALPALSLLPGGAGQQGAGLPAGGGGAAPAGPPVSPFHSPREPTAGGAGGGGGPSLLHFSTHLAERPISPSAGDASSQPPSGSGRRGGAAAANNPFAWGPAQQEALLASVTQAQQAQHGFGQLQGGDWGQLRVGEWGEGNSGGWHAEDRLVSSGARTPGGSEKRLRVRRPQRRRGRDGHRCAGAAGAAAGLAAGCQLAGPGLGTRCSVLPKCPA